MAWNKLSKHATKIGRDTDGRDYVRYHSTDIVRFDPEVIILDTGGYRTATTKRKMNQAAAQFGLRFHVHQHKGQWYLSLPNGETIEYNGDVMLIDRKEGNLIF